MDTYYKIPKRLEEYRKRISFTQEQMGDIMGVGQDHYQRLEKGTVIISNNGLEKIEEHGGDIYYLIPVRSRKQESSMNCWNHARIKKKKNCCCGFIFYVLKLS